MSDEQKDPKDLQSEIEKMIRHSADLLRRSEELRTESDRIASHAAEMRRISDEEREKILKRSNRISS